MRHLKDFSLNEGKVTKAFIDDIVLMKRWEAFESYIKNINPDTDYGIEIKAELLNSFRQGRKEWDLGYDIYVEYDEEAIYQNGVYVQQESDMELIYNIWYAIIANCKSENDFGNLNLIITKEQAKEFGEQYMYDSNDSFIAELEPLEFLEEIIIRIDPEIENLINSGSIKNAVEQGIVIDYEALLPIIFELYPPIEKKYQIEGADIDRMGKLSRAARMLVRSKS